MRVKKTWTELKSLVASKGLYFQYKESATEYFIWARENGDVYYTIIDIADGSPPADSDEEDFVDNYKTEANHRIENKTQVKEFEKTNGAFKTVGKTFTATKNTITTHDLSFPYDVEVLAGGILFAGLNPGDNVSMVVAPDTVVGTITASEAVGQTDISVSATVTANMKPGRYVKFASHTTEYSVTDVDAAAGTISISPTLADALSANDLVKMSVKMVDCLHVDDIQFCCEFGQSKIGASYIAAGTTIRVVYDNQSATDDATVRFYFEVLY